LGNNQTFPSHFTQETNFWVSPHPPKNSPLPIPLKKTSFEFTSSSPPHPKNTLLEKKKLKKKFKKKKNS